MKGKQRCKILKEIRQRIADANDIEFITSECQHKGDCLGTCPKCEAELRYLERELERRQRLGKTIVVAGLSALIATSSVGCDDWIGGRETGGDPLPDERYEQELNGDIALAPEDTELGGVMPLPPEPEDELTGDPAWPDPITKLEVVGSDLTAEELTSILMLGVTRDGLYNSAGWAERHVRQDENSDTYECPISTFDLVTVYYDEQGYIVKVEYADTQPGITLPEDNLS